MVLAHLQKGKQVILIFFFWSISQTETAPSPQGQHNSYEISFQTGDITFRFRTINKPERPRHIASASWISIFNLTWPLKKLERDCDCILWAVSGGKDTIQGHLAKLQNLWRSWHSPMFSYLGFVLIHNNKIYARWRALFRKLDNWNAWVK